jgi:hypothetical protein
MQMRSKKIFDTSKAIMLWENDDQIKQKGKRKRKR